MRHVAGVAFACMVLRFGGERGEKGQARARIPDPEEGSGRARVGSLPQGLARRTWGAAAHQSCLCLPRAARPGLFLSCLALAWLGGRISVCDRCTHQGSKWTLEWTVLGRLYDLGQVTVEISGIRIPVPGQVL